MYHFVFEMQAVRINIEKTNSSQRKAANRKMKMIVMGLFGVHGVLYLTTRMITETGYDFNLAAKIFFSISLVLKLVLDAYVFFVFTSTFSYFLQRKKSALSREALSFSPFNFFIIYSVMFLFFMQILGTLFTISNAIVTLTPAYTTDGYTTYRLIMGDIIFPLRDFIDVLFFSYLFYF